MTQPFETALTQIASIIAGVSGIHQAPEHPGETMNDFPFAAIYLTTGTFGGGAVGTTKGLYNIAIDVLTNRMNLPNDLAILNPFIDTVPTALEAQISGSGQRFSNTISAFGDITIQFIPMVDYAGVKMIGYRFVMNDVKILSNT